MNIFVLPDVVFSLDSNPYASEGRETCALQRMFVAAPFFHEYLSIVSLVLFGIFSERRTKEAKYYMSIVVGNLLRPEHTMRTKCAISDALVRYCVIAYCVVRNNDGTMKQC